MREDQELISVPGFGFYSEEEWRVFGPMRRSENGNHSDAEVCQMIGFLWESTVKDRDSYCPPQWDGVAACIPSARRNEIAVLPCIPYWDNEYYDTSYNITKQCLDNGRWANYTNYEDCLNHQIAPPLDQATGPVTEWEVLIFLLGYSVSIISLLFAIFIFMYFREMRCLRHKIHLNLFLSVLTANLDWVITYAVTHFMINYRDNPETLTSLSTVNCILHVLLRYFHLTNFFWMFTEGLYLFLQVQASFSVGRLKLRHCVSIGWGAPLLLTLLWTLLIYCQNQTEVYNSQASNGRHSVNVSDLGGCPFMVESEAARNYELYSYTIPICFLLASNFFFAIWILAIVYSKLRGNNDAPTSSQNINLRALKAFIIIVPLLGITYLVTIVGPKETTTTFATIFIFTRNVSVSFTGFFITLPYCYFNSEVCSMIKSHWDRWRDRNNIGYGPASRANSIALAGMYNVSETARKRSSYGYHTVTTVTTVGTEDRSRHGTAETVEQVVTKQHNHVMGSPSHGQQISWKTYDGPLVPKPDLVQHSQKVDSREASNREENM